ncbi:GNAT family N-acetyltransferase [Luteimonas sp. e5]
MSNTSTCQLEAGGCSLQVRLTPWDERALGMRTAEILALAATSDQTTTHIRELLGRAEDWARQQQAGYLFGRFDANHAETKQAVLGCGFTIVECSLALSKAGFAGLPPVPSGMRPTMRPAVPEDIPVLAEIARVDFDHGRFLEDPAIPRELAAERSANWISDLVCQGLAQVAMSRGQCIGFHAEQVDWEERHADLILTGTASAYAMLSLPLWTVALQSLHQRGVTRCSTLISAANTGVLNLYSRLGFHFDATLMGYRKFL